MIVGNNQGQGRELSGLAINFHVRHSIIETPNTLVARIFNLSPTTRNQIVNEFTRVILQAGYAGNFGRIFQGEIKQIFRGRESAVDDYVDIYAADGDTAHNWATLNRTLAAGHTASDVYDSVSDSMKPFQVQPGEKPAELKNAPQAPRARVLFGMTREEARTLAQSYGLNWYLENGTLQFLTQSAYKPGDVAIISDQTGMVGVPEQTMDGIAVTVLLNPSIGSGSLIEIRPSAGQDFAVAGYQRSGPIGLNYTSVDIPPSIDAHGRYKVLFADHIGETRGTAWYTRITCISTDPTAIQPTTRSVIGATG